jgi:hypothetical protein
MFIWIAAVLAIGAIIVSLISSLTRRSGLLELGSVSTQWLAEHRQYQEGDRSR